jgi:peptidoglycan/xylan/chitin deacetylase (PgdA/CDA1 family)
VTAKIEPGSSTNELKAYSRSSLYLAYHEITEVKSKYLYSVSVSQFNDHLRCVRRLGSMDHSRPDAVHITFDDGHISQYVRAFPALRELGMKATFFVTAGWMERPGYMDWKRLRELSREGYEVQSHGWSHAHLTVCSDQELSAELRRSKSVLEDHLGVEVTAISAPGGRWNQRVLRACEEAGYKRLFVSDPWIAEKRRGQIEVLGRWMVTRTMDGNEIVSLVGRGSTSMALLRARNLLKLTTRMIIGDRAYQALWRRAARKSHIQTSFTI